jgi:hypothetical protein
MSRTYFLLRLNLVSKFIPPLVCSGGMSEAHTAAQLADDGDGSFVIEGAVNTACRCPTPYQPLFHRN